jgi:iron(III) transport system substrate-binding protein
MRLLVPAALLLGALCVWHFAGKNSRDPLVLYCAHDAVFAEEIIHRFEEKTGLAVATRFDTEATKSLGLVEMLLREKAAPRCDVFWNNEVLGTIDLQRHGVLLPYKGSGHARIPAQFKDDAGYWTGFAARLRVQIINTKTTRLDDVRQRMDGDLQRVAIALPLYGTTLTHYSALWQQWGRERLIAWHRDCRARGIRELRGNAAVKDAVASGACDIGLTDTDDYFDAVDAHAPVTFAPVRLAHGETLCIPNSVAMIRGTRHQFAAQRLVDYLLSEETETALAHSASRQIPLGPVNLAALPGDVRQLLPLVQESFPLKEEAFRARAECLAWLKAEYLP